MIAETIHTCSYECERPECIRAQRDELAARLTAETSNARWELRMADVREDAREPLQLLREKLAHDEDGWAALCRLMPMLAAAPPPPADAEVWMFKGTDGAWHTFLNEQHRLDTIADGRWEVRKFTALSQQPEPKPEARGVVDEDALRDARTIYDIACIRESRDNATREDVEFKAICLRNYNRIAALTAAQQSTARGMVDEGSRTVTSQLLHWGGIPVCVTGTVTTSPGNWPLIDTALTEARDDR